MTINLKDYANKRVVVTLRNEWMLESFVCPNKGYEVYSYSIDGRNYSNDGRICIHVVNPYDIVDIKLAEEDPKPSMTNCVAEGEPPNGCSAWNVWYEKFGSRGILNNLKISSLNDKPEPVITRVEVITHKREYINWNKDNVITTSLQDEGRTLKVFVNKSTEEPEMISTKFYDELSALEKSLYDIGKEQGSKQWATALTGFIDKLGGDSPALWEWKGTTPTPEKVVECLQELFDFHMQIAADNELEACVEWFRQNNFRLDVRTTFRDARRPQPTLKSQALKDFEMVRKHSDVIPEILDTIENALKSLPDEKGV